MSPAEVGELRAALENERDRISGAIAGVGENGRVGAEEDAEQGGGGADSASTTFDRELDEGLQESAVQTLGQIEAALARLDDGTYGICERCGKPISEERLRARPWASLCIDDQRLADRR